MFSFHQHDACIALIFPSACGVSHLIESAVPLFRLSQLAQQEQRQWSSGASTHTSLMV